MSAFLLALLLSGIPQDQQLPEVGPAQQPPANADAIMAEINAAWQTWYDSLHGVRIELQGTTTSYQTPAAPAASPDVELTEPSTDRMAIDFQNGRAHIEWVRSLYNISSQEWARERRMFLHDGKDYQEYLPAQDNQAINSKFDQFAWQLEIGGRKPITDLFDTTSSNLPLYCLSLPPVRRIADFTFPLQLDADRFHVEELLLDNGRRIAVISDRDPSGKNTQVHYRLRVELDRNCVISRSEHYDGNERAWTLDVEHQQRDGAWLPVRGRWQLGSQGRLDSERVFEVTVCELNPTFKPEELHIEPQPGMVVLTSVNGQSGSFILDKDGEPTINAQDLKNRLLLEESAATRIRWWLWGTAGLVVVLLIVFLLRWRRSL